MRDLADLDKDWFKRQLKVAVDATENWPHWAKREAQIGPYSPYRQGEKMMSDNQIADAFRANPGDPEISDRIMANIQEANDTAPDPSGAAGGITQGERDGAIGRVHKAKELIFRLAEKGDKAWSMSVPPQPDDSDNILLEVVSMVPRLLAALEAAEREIGRLQRVNYKEVAEVKSRADFDRRHYEERLKSMGSLLKENLLLSERADTAEAMLADFTTMVKERDEEIRGLKADFEMASRLIRRHFVNTSPLTQEEKAYVDQIVDSPPVGRSMQDTIGQ